MKNLPTLRQLRYLVTVSETRHFGRAAEICAVTQSTLSAGVQELEGLLGTRLIERRSRRQVVFTPLGEEIVERARAVLADAEALVDAAQAGSLPLVGDLHLGVIPTIGPYVLPRLVPALREAYGGLRLFLREEQSANLLSLLNAGRIDAALMALPYAVGDLPRVELATEEVVLAMPENHPLAAFDDIAVEKLESETMLMLEDGHCLREHAMEACHLTRSRGNEAFQATSLSTLVQMVAGGVGVTLMPSIAVPVEARPGSGVVVRPITGARAARTLALLWRPASPRSRDYRLLADAIGTAITGALSDAGRQLAGQRKEAKEA
ncbi:LysR substrate-binding domain-containing protein [Rhodospirillum rubrum]|uniref:Transcriptional regulator, LysR family n=1 Tax=Rhodospirillum rubrum (strain ATCC 11170 / ATH 1.1.1 / DSM 467 / LMG 4362 / NCIMB 8255 / S1) TaxID=269796 RepID=Q2RXK6_RHORT|nr:LysR substrate-binding domain-containing protein [Rhodospirillum rubrum]ABC21139.1 transcriptional regulator, LysR family [Rhodospirillum rubrum ATCC 11170]AEO46808.1 LysR family transcriptional regulator [Rhodospirillum rubrum F11]MBK5952687.1 LysR family transcriptional regulator [Rhodospirillum rubrum]QXG80831.1 LysR family transcriptional regulator [Rhodospirillum rubrum]HCF18632.1 LysR family transcriptional regulator [Rhodospirillum rubrum]